MNQDYTKDLMVDIETLGIEFNSVITQIGACYFNLETGEIYEKFLVNISIQDCLNHGLIVNGDAIKFWLNQLNRSFLESPVELSKALQMFRDFCKINKKAHIWSHSTFDITIITNAYRAIKQGIPFSYKNICDIRTLVYLANNKKEKTKKGDEKTHNGLEDCIYQVKYCSEAFNILHYKELKTK